MQIITVSANFIFSNNCTLAHLQELAASPFVGYSQDAVEKLAKQQLSKASGGKGGKSAGIGDLPYGKLRTCIVNKLENNPDIADAFKAGQMEFEFMHLPDLDMGTAGANKAKRQSNGPRATGAGGKGNLTGAYTVGPKKCGLKATPDTDAGKHSIWQHVFTCSSFEEFFSKAPAKAVTKTGRVITAYSEINWAIKSGWIAPVQQA
jgi:hypothetical protein